MYVSMECLLIWKSSILGITTNIKFQGKTVYQRFCALIYFPRETGNGNFHALALPARLSSAFASLVISGAPIIGNIDKSVGRRRPILWSILIPSVEKKNMFNFILCFCFPTDKNLVIHPTILLTLRHYTYLN